MLEILKQLVSDIESGKVEVEGEYLVGHSVEPKPNDNFRCYEQTGGRTLLIVYRPKKEWDKAA